MQQACQSATLLCLHANPSSVTWGDISNSTLTAISLRGLTKWHKHLTTAFNNSTLRRLIPPWYFMSAPTVNQHGNGSWLNKPTQSHLHSLERGRLSFLPKLHHDPDCSLPASSKWCLTRANVQPGVSQLGLPERLSHSLQGKTLKELMSFTRYLTLMSKLAGSQTQHNSDTLKEVFRTCFSLPQSFQTHHRHLHFIPLCNRH